MNMFRRRPETNNRAPVDVLQERPTHVTKNLQIGNAQIVLAEVEMVPRFVVHINGIPQRPARESDMHLRINLRPTDGRPALKFTVSATYMPREIAADIQWNGTGLDGLFHDVFRFFGVRSLSKLNGRLVRILTDGDDVCAIGDYLEDRWFTRLGYQPNCDAYFSSMAAPGTLMADQHNFLFRVGEIYVSETQNARIKLATMVPGSQFMEVVVKLADIATTSPMRRRNEPKEIVVRYRPTSMDELNALLNELCEVGGVSQLERLNGRLVRFSYGRIGDVSFSGAEREAARHFYLHHPVRDSVVDMANYRGTRDNVEHTDE